MQKTIVRFGVLSSLLMLVLFGASFLFIGRINYQTQELLGYIGIVLPLLFIYFGIRYFRDRTNGGTLSFGKGLQVGILIALFPTVLFGAADTIYTTYINPDFYDEYCKASLEKMKEALPANEYAIKSKQILDSKEMFMDNPALQFFVMAMTVFVIGVIITVISSLILKRKKIA